MMMLLFEFLHFFEGGILYFSYSNVYRCAYFLEYVGICKKILESSNPEPSVLRISVYTSNYKIHVENNQFLLDGVRISSQKSAFHC